MSRSEVSATERWAELREGDLAEHLGATLTRFSGELEPRYLPTFFMGVERAAATVAILRGEAALREAHARMLSNLEALARRVGTKPSAADHLVAAGLIGYGSVARAAGIEDVPGPKRVAPWLEAIAKESKGDEALQLRIALLAIAEKKAALVPKLLGKRAERPAPGQLFGFDTLGFVHHLAAAKSFAEVEPAWRDHVAGFPWKHAAGTLDLTHLAHAARVVYATIGEHGIGDVIARLRKLIA